MLNWGLIPFWAKDPKIGARMINARSETAAQKPSFRAAFRRRRCLVIADGFYEWQKQNGTKQPYLHPPARHAPLCLCRAVGALGRARCQRDRVLHPAHHRAQRLSPARAQPHAGDTQSRRTMSSGSTPRSSNLT